jgi:hypothetical protein
MSRRRNTSRSSLDDFQQIFSGIGFRRKLDHQLSAADGYVFLIERVESLLAFFTDSDQISLTTESDSQQQMFMIFWRVSSEMAFAKRTGLNFILMTFYLILYR